MKRLVAWLILATVLVTVFSACRQERPPAYLQDYTLCNNPDSAGQDYPRDSNLTSHPWGSNVCFLEATFDDSTSFKGHVFQDTAVFTDASFSNYVDLSSDTFKKAAYFDDVSF